MFFGDAGPVHPAVGEEFGFGGPGVPPRGFGNGATAEWATATTAAPAVTRGSTATARRRRRQSALRWWSEAGNAMSEGQRRWTVGCGGLGGNGGDGGRAGLCFDRCSADGGPATAPAGGGVGMSGRLAVDRSRLRLRTATARDPASPDDDGVDVARQSDIVDRLMPAFGMRHQLRKSLSAIGINRRGQWQWSSAVARARPSVGATRGRYRARMSGNFTAGARAPSV